jgi:hypothetical protein
MQTLAKSPLNELSPEEQVWACLSHGCDEIHSLIGKVESTSTDGTKHWGNMFNPQELRVRTLAGGDIPPDNILNNIVAVLDRTLRMLAYKFAWVSDGSIQFPQRTSVSRSTVDEAGDTFLLGHAWGLLEDASEQLRYFGGSIEVRRLTIPADGSPEQEADGVLFSVQKGLMRWEQIARARLDHLTVLNGAKLSALAEIKAKIKNPRIAAVAQAPEEFVAEIELLAIMMLDDSFHYLITTSFHEYGGLALREWVRCYAILAEWYAKGPNAQPVYDVVELDPVEFVEPWDARE